MTGHVEETEMDSNVKPSKEQVRQWLASQVARHEPPPDIKQIRRELGWDLVDAARDDGVKASQ